MKNYFKISELTRSQTALRKGIDNTPSDSELKNLELLIDRVLNPAREALGEPIYVNSGYRCLKLNTVLGGSKTSQHMKGEAADIELGDKSRESNMKLFEWIRNNLEFDQLINEYDYSWIHVSFKEFGNRRQVLKAEKINGRTKYTNI